MELYICERFRCGDEILVNTPLKKGMSISRSHVRRFKGYVRLG